MAVVLLWSVLRVEHGGVTVWYVVDVLREYIFSRCTSATRTPMDTITTDLPTRT
jgi:hypothetical protein